MNEFQNEDYHIWKIKMELATQDNSHAQMEIKQKLNCLQHPLLQDNFTKVLTSSKCLLINKGQSYGGYQLHSNVPVFLLLQGQVQIQCINMQGDTQTIQTYNQPGVIQLQQNDLKAKFGQTNLPLVTQFQLVAAQRCILIELSMQSVSKAMKVDEDKVTLREEIIMRKYMLIALKHITKIIWSKGGKLTKFYLLQGRICYYSIKNKHILTCYQQGYFNPQQFANTDIALYIFEGAKLMILEQEMLKDQVVIGAEIKRQQHVLSIQKKYQKMNVQEKSKMQEKLIAKYDLNRKETEKDIMGLEEKPIATKTAQKRLKSKNDFIQTSSSIKDKCGIRIRKTKRAT